MTKKPEAKRPTESELRDLLYDFYLVGHMNGREPILSQPIAVKAFDPTARQLTAMRAAMAMGVRANRQMTLSNAMSTNEGRLFTQDEVVAEVEHLLGKKLVELVVAVEPEQQELAAMTSQIPTTQEIPPSRHRLAADVDPDFFKNTRPAAVEEWPFGRSPRA